MSAARRAVPGRPTVAIFKFASCDGCQLSLLDCEDELLLLADRVQFAHFLEASRTTIRGPWDLVLVEGSITTHDDARAIQEIRRQARTLVTIGACATTGGIQALRNAADIAEWTRCVYPRPEFISTLATSTPISAHVPVDAELQGCPVDKGQLVALISAFLAGRRLPTPAHAVCLECKQRGVPCVMVSRGMPCMGPVTHAGCGALCPAHDRGCFGCFGPSDTPNTASLAARWSEGLGARPVQLQRAFHAFTNGAPAFRREGSNHD